MSINTEPMALHYVLFLISECSCELYISYLLMAITAKSYCIAENFAYFAWAAQLVYGSVTVRDILCVSI